jgi:tetratricopeptide (TPR) repeat protein
MKRTVKSVVFCAAVLSSALAFAEPRSADDWYKEGETQYNLGNFDKAADAFKEGYTLETLDNKKPAYLYNVAQAYRQGKKCKDAAFFYKRYLSLKDQDTAKPLAAEKRTEIEGWINELEECEKNQESIAHKTPDTTIPSGPTTTKPTGTNPTTTTTKPTTVPATTKVADSNNGDGDGEGSASDGGDVHGSTTVEQPKLLSLRLTGGVAKVGAGDSTVPIEPTFNLFAGYPIAVSPELVIDVGANIGFTPVPYTNTMTHAKATGQLISALADVGATYAVTPKIGLRGDLGVGVLVFGGISDAGNPFTEMGASSTGALGMFAIRAAASVDYAFTPNVYGTVTPIAFSYSPAKTGLRDDIKSLTRLDFMLGVGYRM